MWGGKEYWCGCLFLFVLFLVYFGSQNEFLKVYQGKCLRYVLDIGITWSLVGGGLCGIRWRVLGMKGEGGSPREVPLGPSVLSGFGPGVLRGSSPSALRELWPPGASG